jgi:hypothetical protein
MAVRGHDRHRRAGTLRGVEARSLRRLRMVTLSATVAALVLPPGAYAATPDGAVASLTSTVERTVGAVSDTTGEVTTAVESAAPPAQPVTSAVRDATTTVSRQATGAVDEITAAPPAVVEKATGAAVKVAAGGADKTPAAPPPAAHPSTPAAPGHGGDEGRSTHRDTAVAVPATPAARRPAEPRHLEERSSPIRDRGERVAPGQPPVAQSASAGGRPRASEGAPEDGSSAPGRDLPAMTGGSALAPGTGAGLAGLALLAIALCLTEPRVLRSLLTPPAEMRPALFVSALERPG